MKISQLINQNSEPSGLAFYCNGCKRVHAVNTNPNKQWGFNGDFNKPTFTPSVLVEYKHPKGYSNNNPAPHDWDGEWVTDICHSFVTAGFIQYLPDCTHELAGQTIELPEFKWEEDGENA